jgi:hypothetical protein
LLRVTDLELVTLVTAIVGAATGILGSATGIIALVRDRPRLRLQRREFDEKRLRTERPDLRQPEAVLEVSLDLAQPFYCLTITNAGLRPITILEAHAALADPSDGLDFHWHSHWFRSLQSLDLFDRNVHCVLTETEPVAKIIYPVPPSRELLSLNITTAGRTYR